MVELYDVSLDHINIYLGILLPIADKINNTTATLAIVAAV
jgi:hypothetical protein